MSKELVQDRVIKYLTENLYVPMDMIDTNVPLSEFEEGAEGTIDVLVNVEAKDGYFVPVMVIQCMDEDIPMEGEILEKQIEKLEEIDNLTLSGRVVLTNGDQMMYADWRGEENEEKDIPEYDVMVKEFEESEAFAEKFEEEHGHCDCGHDHGDGCDCGNH
ncbi:hypothetical protein EXD82_02705 [Peptacetobacter hominis]|uniref:Type I restriction enzyme R protein N-terminal domain-containing protein n=1 Tax=Peptacetobacter hominis TaxID=2743610 RepID=A0A544QX86_9FIRM|nr:type I restriction enzyme HsdR N-terminal domain-containing protein [Peptacetobacter hominis]TQQ85322.1 hypothetical protein EXD82_02705 [Peptacetobacter hominis]